MDIYNLILPGNCQSPRGNLALMVILPYLKVTFDLNLADSTGF